MRSSPGALRAGTAPGPRAVTSSEIERLLALAQAGLDASRTGEAEALACQAVGILDEDHEADDGSRARVGVAALGALGAALRVQGRYGEAEASLRASLALADSADDAELLIVKAANDLAVLCKYTARFDEAEVLYRRALQIAEARRGPDHVEVATLWHNIAGLDHSRGHHARAEPAARRALEIRIRALGAAHPDVAADAAALGAILDALGRLDEAELLLRGALEMFTALHGPRHHEVAINTNNLAAVQYRRGRIDDAEALWRQTLSVKQELLGADHPELATTIVNLGVVAAGRGQEREARVHFERALELLGEDIATDHPVHRAATESLAKLAESARDDLAFRRGSGRGGV